MTLYQRKKQQRADLTPLLIDEVAPEVRLDASWSPRLSSLHDFGQKWEEMFRAQSLQFAYWAQSREFLERILSQIQGLDKNQKRKVWVDIRLTEKEQQYELLIRDNGVLFNPLEKEENNPEGVEKMQYAQLLSLNQTHIVFKKK